MRRLDSLTGLRFFAAGIVLLYHASLFWDLPSWLRFADAGLTGVSFFFVLSGFVLMWSRREGEAAPTFWWHRFARVWPLHFLTFLLALMLLPAVGIEGSLLNAGLLQAWHPDIAISHGLNQPSWSLSAEAFFYLLFPLLVVPVARCRPRRVIAITAGMALAFAVIALALSEGSVSRWLLYTFPLYRLGEFVTGMALAVAIRRGWRPRLSLRYVLVGTAAVYAVWGTLMAGKVMPFVSGAVMVVPFALLICAAAASDIDTGGSRLSGRWLVLLGQWSFALYLIHWPVLKGMRALGDAAWVAIPAGVLSIALAAALFTFFERPVERFLRQLRPRYRRELPQYRHGDSNPGFRRERAAS
jgi:peptidoglycan/LPS O-acetylase OafA/YrhL